MSLLCIWCPISLRTWDSRFRHEQCFHHSLMLTLRCHFFPLHPRVFMYQTLMLLDGSDTRRPFVLLLPKWMVLKMCLWFCGSGSRACMLQYMHYYSMRPREAELISMVTGLSDRTREEGCNGKLPVCCKALKRGASAVHSGCMTVYFLFPCLSYISTYDGRCTDVWFRHLVCMCLFQLHACAQQGEEEGRCCVQEVKSSGCTQGRMVCVWSNRTAASAANHTFWVSPSIFFLLSRGKCQRGQVSVSSIPLSTRCTQSPFDTHILHARPHNQSRFEALLLDLLPWPLPLRDRWPRFNTHPLRTLDMGDMNNWIAEE